MNPSPEIAEICGLIIGDGWIQKRGCSLFITGDITEDREYYDNHLSNLFSKTFLKTKPKLFPYWKVYGLGIYNKEVINKLIDLGIQPGKKVYTAKIPSWSFDSKEISASLLRGLFDADGSIFCGKSYGKYAKGFRLSYHHDMRLRIGSASKQLCEDIKKLGKNIDLEFVGPRLIKGKFSNKRNNHNFYVLELNKDSSIINFFEKSVIPKNSKHTTKYKIWKRFGFCPPKTNLKETVDRKVVLKYVDKA